MAAHLPNVRIKERIQTPNPKSNKIRRRDAKWRKQMDRAMAIHWLKEKYHAER